MNIHSPIKEFLRITEFQQKALKKLGVLTIGDLLYHFPTRYGDIAEIKNVAGLTKGESAVVFGKISNLKPSKAWRKKIPMATATLSSETGSIKVVWFNQPYIAKMIVDGSLVRVEGKVAERKGELYFSNPKIEHASGFVLPKESLLKEKGDDSHSLHPVYPESRGVTSNWFYHAIQKLLKTPILDEINDPIPEEILKKYKLPDLKTSLIWIHAPRKHPDALAAKKRFAFEEVFYIQIDKSRQKKIWQENNSYKIKKILADIEEFIERFPFPLTGAQKKATEQILNDFNKDFPMSRLLEGDVGSGKTAVAAAAAYAVITTRPNGQDFGNLQVAYMAPTEILASQHFEFFIQYFKNSGVQVGLITGSGCRKFPSKINPSGWTDISRNQLLKWVENGEIPILIGTHTLIQKTVDFKHLALVIIDEQHRFGTKQRQALAQKGNVVPHLLSMTATPIPRTLSLTIYGDLDLSLLDELPAGRKWPETKIVLPDQRDSTYEFMRKEIKSGRQAFVICPRIDEPDPNKEFALQAKSAIEEAKRLKKEIFPEFEIEVMHSKLKPADKEKIMNEFKNGKIQILVSTSVVEVGVNVPNATIIVIEGAERFGLAQLHQLRGRVMRSSFQPYCFVFTDSKSKTSRDRLKALQNAKSGFELAEHDLTQRGAGDLRGLKQWGITDIGMEALKNLKMVEAARTEAQRIIEEDSELLSYPELKKQATKTESKIHFE